MAVHVSRAEPKPDFDEIARCSYLFCGSDEGARRHSIISKVLGNCALADVNSFAYLRNVIGKLAGDWPNAKIAELMPAACGCRPEKSREPGGSAGRARLRHRTQSGIFVAPSCRQRAPRIPFPPESLGTRSPPGGAETDLRAARCREGGVGHLPRRWRQRGAEGSFPDRLVVLRDCSACSLSRRGRRSQHAR
jgi:hypothetical protein